MKDYKINYRPDLEYEKDYTMEGRYEKTEFTTSPTTTTPQEELQALADEVKDLLVLLEGLPSSIGQLLSTSVSGIGYLIGTFDPELGTEPVIGGITITIPTVDIITVPTATPIKDPVVYTPVDGLEIPDDNIFPDLPSINIIVTQDDGPEIKISSQFQKDLRNIFANFNFSLKDKINNYYVGLFKAAEDCGVKSFEILQREYKGSSKDIVNKYVSDAIIKSQIVRDQKQRLIKKLFDIDEMMITIRQCKIAEELKIRYYKAQYDNNSTILKTNKNIILSDSRHEYDIKYKENLFGLYKYLNSTVILIDECLQQALMESKAKAILIKEEGIKL